jgi:phthiocerol/phenolphthiocerol synthesis type-I polyketide synthase C
MLSAKPSTLVELLRSRALYQPNQHAYTFLLDGEREGPKWTYAELDRHARAIGALLQTYNASGERVLLLYPPGLEYIAAFFGCLYAGAVAVPAYPPRNRRYLPRIQTIVEDAQARFLLTIEKTQAKIQTWLTQTSSLTSLHMLATDNLSEEMEKEWQEPDIETNSLAFLQYTSGSTSMPKGVMVSHNNLLHNSGLIQQYFGHSSHSKGVIWLPPYHDMGLIGGILQPLFVGFPVILMSPTAFLQRPIRWLEAISNYRATSSGGPNFAYDLCVNKISPDQKKMLDLSSWNLAFNGAEPIHPETLENFAETFESCGFRKEAFYPCYGLAEATLFVTGGKKSELPVIRAFHATEMEHNHVIELQEEKGHRLIGCGQNLRDQTIVIVDPESLTQCLPDQVGEIWISGPGVAQGYWNRLDISQESFQAYLKDPGEESVLNGVKGPFLRTGDLGFIKDDELFITGRLKDLIIIRGRNHYPQDIEWNVEHSHPAIRRNSSAAFSVDIANEERLVVVAEVERRYRHRQHLDEEKYIEIEQRNLPDLEQSDIEPGFSQDIHQYPDLKKAIIDIRQVVAEHHDLNLYAVLLIKATTISRTSSGKIQRHLCKDKFLNESLDVVAMWSESPLENMLDNRSALESEKQEVEKQHDLQTPSSTSPRKGLRTGFQKPTQTAEAIQNWLVSRFAERLGIKPHEIDIREPFARYGIDSVQAVSLSTELEDWLGYPLSPTLIYNYPNIAVLSKYLSVSSEIADVTAKIQTVRKTGTEPIAVIGLGCRFPGAENPEAFWQLLHNGGDAITEVPSDRWDVDAFYDPTPATPGKMNTRWGGFLEHVDSFDSEFFGLSPREVEHMDPQQRLLLEVAWEALENTGQSPELLAGSYAGVFIGISSYDYSRFQYSTNMDAYTGTGNAMSIAANRLSYFLNLRGPSVAIDTACSSSLVATHQACLSLRNKECDLALAGGVNLILTPDTTISLSQTRLMSADGRCKTFDSRADGYVRSEGCGIIVLKRLSDALRDGDNILALIRGSAVNQDGRSNGLTAPNGFAQQAVIYQALENAGVVPSQISYFEAHGTGTALGDPIEVNALKEVLIAGRSSEHPCWIGSVKTNIGHLEAASGIAGLIKVVLALQHEEIPPHLHLKQLNPNISLEGTPFLIPTKPQKWLVGKDRRLAGVSTFGFGGTNAHVVLEETLAKAKITVEVERPTHILTLSARSENALEELAKRYETYLESHEQVPLADICFTANTGRTSFDHRVAIITESHGQLREQLHAFGERKKVAGLVSGQVRPGNSQKVAFLFTGQGSQYVGMGRQLYETQPTFRQALDRCNEILRPYLEKPLLEVLYPEKFKNSETPNLIDETAYTQPALFALEYALAELWMSWKIIPAVVMGHSIGEYVAACVARVFSLEDGLKLIAERARLMQALPRNGKMVVLFAEETQVAEAIQPYNQKVSISAVNGPKITVISGKNEAIEAVTASLEKADVKTKQLQVSHAFHSPLMESILPDFERVAKEVKYFSPWINMVSGVSGDLATAEITTPEYWCHHIRQPVQFKKSMETLLEQGYEVFIEIGPTPMLLGMGSQISSSFQFPVSSFQSLWLPSLRRGRSDWQQLLQSLGELHVRGIRVDWAGFGRDYPRRRTALPTYPFQRQRYWVKTGVNLYRQTSQQFQIDTRGKIVRPLLGQRLYSALREIQFESQITQDSPTFLKHHRIFEMAILPATAYVEMALAAGAAVFKSDTLVLEKLVIQQPLVLPKEKGKTIQTILTPDGNRMASFQIFSLTRDEANEEPIWVLHASGKVLAEDKNIQAPFGELPALQAQCREEISVEDTYQRYRDRGIEYGSHFQAIKHLWRHEREVLGRIQLPEALLEDAGDYMLHPVLLDACLQILGVAIADDDDQSIYLPISVESLRVCRHPGSRLWAHARMHPVEDSIHQSLTADLCLCDENGEVIVQIEGLSLTRTSREVFLRGIQKPFDDWFYEITWQVQTQSQTQPEAEEEPGSWLIFTDEGEIGVGLAQLLKDHGQRCVLVFPGQNYERRENEHYIINPSEFHDFQQLLQESIGDNQPLYRGIIHLWGLEKTQELTLDILQQTQTLGCGSVLHLIQAITQTGWSSFPRLWLVTSGAQPIGNSPILLNVQQAPLWGLGKVVALEHPDLACVRLDLDPAGNHDEIQHLFGELWASDNEDQIAYRQGTRYVARLVRHHSQHLESQVQLHVPTDGLFQVKMSKYGILENLTLAPMTRRKPGAGEVEIEVRTAGLNFRDVLHALGMLKEHAERLGIESATDMPFGFECAGTIAAVGDDVSGFKVGDDVIAVLAIGSLSSFVIVNAKFVVPKPQILSFEEAATLPLTFLTAYYGLCSLAKIGSGDKVLIHAAAGGVGQAAVQLAQRVGSEVFATASLGKWEFLKSIGIKHITNSRTLDFAKDVLEITKGQGVDIVLNSLSGEYVDKSFAVLKQGGRFVELGKIGIWDEQQVQERRPDLSYFPFDLGEVARDNPDLISSILKDIMQGLEDGTLKSLPHKVFPIREVVNAFRYMAQAKHIGKVVIDCRLDKPSIITPDSSYLITGGLGALGLKVAQWMVEQGAMHLVLTGRRGVTSETAQDVVSQLRQAGVRIDIKQVDVSSPEEMAGMIEKLQSSMSPLRGVVHAAGVLDDGFLMQQNWTQFRKVMIPKVDGAWNLHVLTQDISLDFFVCFSSVAALLGSPGQGNYTAANTFLDALAHYRRALGLPGLSINWGPWADVGMASGLDSHSQSRWSDCGVGVIFPEQGVQVLGKLLDRDTAQVGVLSVTWSKFLRQFPRGMESPFLEVFRKATAPPAAQKAEFFEQFQAVSVKDRRDFLMTYLRSQLVNVLGMNSPEQIGPRKRLFDMGLDSLMAVELKNRLEAELGCSLRSTLLFDYPTLEALVDYLMKEVLSEEVSPESIEESQETQEEEGKDLTDLDELSEDEIGALLDEKIATIEEK